MCLHGSSMIFLIETRCYLIERLLIGDTESRTTPYNNVSDQFVVLETIPLLQYDYFNFLLHYNQLFLVAAGKRQWTRVCKG